jgi:hypothetical protein
MVMSDPTLLQDLFLLNPHFVSALLFRFLGPSLEWDVVCCDARSVGAGIRNRGATLFVVYRVDGVGA